MLLKIVFYQLTVKLPAIRDFTLIPFYKHVDFLGFESFFELEFSDVAQK